MSRWDDFWRDIAEDIEQKFNRGNPSLWSRSVSEEFIIELEAILLNKAKNDVYFARILGLKTNNDGVPYLELISPATVENIFKYKRTKGNKFTRNCFAIYLGYKSAEDYLYQKKSNPNLENREEVPPQEKTKPISVIVELPDADYTKEDNKEQWMIYELAFLWFGKEPPSIQAHFYQMTREMEALKLSLHQSVEKGLLEAKTEIFPDGITRYVTREALEKFIETQKLEKPEFLKRDERQN